MTEATTSAVHLIPRTVLFGNPERTQPRISPDGRHLVYLQDKGGNEDWQLYAVDPATKETRDLTPFENVQARPLEKNKRFPDELLVELNRRDPQLHDVPRLNLATGELELVAENPGNVAGWVADVDMQVSGALSAHPD